MGRCCVEREKISSASSELVTVLHSSAGGGGDPPQVNHWAALPCWPDQSGGSGRGGLAMLDRRKFCVCSFKYFICIHLPPLQMKDLFSFSLFPICGRLIAVVLMNFWSVGTQRASAMHSTGHDTPVVPCTRREPTPAQSHNHTRDVSQRENTAVFLASIKN